MEVRNLHEAAGDLIAAAQEALDAAAEAPPEIDSYLVAKAHAQATVAVALELRALRAALAPASTTTAETAAVGWPVRPEADL